jgi:hypothetical protein
VEFLKSNKKTVVLVLSLLLNALGGFGVIPPVAGEIAREVVCAPVPAASSAPVGVDAGVAP